jgi:hypothetical protein
MVIWMNKKEVIEAERKFVCGGYLRQALERANCEREVANRIIDAVMFYRHY